MPWQLLTTGDGSHTLYNGDLDESYHSRFGAIQESRHVFVMNGFSPLADRLSPCLKNGGSVAVMNILEVGFGTGLNALLTLLESESTKIHVRYTAVEPHPLPPEIYLELNHLNQLSRPEFKRQFLQMHTLPHAGSISLSDCFTFEKQILPIQIYKTDQKFDLIYFDAFAPEKQPEIWHKPVLQKMCDFLRDGGIMATYCAQGALRRSLKDIGFRVVSRPGPPGKREITVAQKNRGDCWGDCRGDS